MLETRDATGNMVGGVVAAAFGGPLPDAIQEMGRLVGDWALSSGGPAVGEISTAPEPTKATAETGKPVTAWLSPQLELDPLDLASQSNKIAHSGQLAPQGAADVATSERPNRFLDDSLLQTSGATIRISSLIPPFQPSSPPLLQSPNMASSGTDTGRALSGAGVTIAPLSTTPAAPMGIRGNFESVPDDPPSNQAPIATDDIVTTDEDTPVEINVLANDSDPDGDTLTIDGWDDPANGTVELVSDGVLKYTPNPDYENTITGYQPPDTFTYTVTDGLATATATVTITVNTVNDAPVAFGDGAAFLNAYTEPPDPNNPDALVSLYSIGGETNLFTNDIDYDGYDSNYDNQVLQIAATDMTGTVGQVTISTDGYVQWSVPWDYSGATEFRYQVIDDQGGVSNWATMKLWAISGQADPPPSVTANPDQFFVGDDPASGNVVANDSGGATYAVLQSHPGSGRILSFGFDGAVQYQPGLEHGDAFFTYVVFNADGSSNGGARADLSAVNMDIYDGQNGTARLSEQKENKFGAITVANRNDTDSDYTKDDIDSIVQAGGQAVGEDEKDLMRLAVHQPKGMQGDVAISSNSSAVYFYNNSLADVNGLYGTAVELGADKFDQGTEGNKYAVIWVEARQWSASVADITITMTYGGVTENAKVTAIWAEMTAFHATGWQGGSMVPPNTDKNYNNYFNLGDNNTGKLGTDIVPYTRAQEQWFANGMEIEFSLRPAGIGKLKSRVAFDVSRSFEGLAGFKSAADGSDVGVVAISLPANRDAANDDYGSLDEANLAQFDRMYVFDFPTTPLTPATLNAYSNLYQRMNGFEFVRVMIGTNPKFDHPKDRGVRINSGPPGPVQGSRASELYSWHSQLWFQKDAAGNWSRPLDQNGQLDKNYNEVDQGTKPLC